MGMCFMHMLVILVTVMCLVSLGFRLAGWFMLMHGRVAMRVSVVAFMCRAPLRLFRPGHVSVWCVASIMNVVVMSLLSGMVTMFLQGRRWFSSVTAVSLSMPT